MDIDCRMEGGFAIIKVADTGIGMKAEDIRQLFRPFKQVDTGITRQYEGTGLGLSISKRLVEMLGGKISVESEPGKGEYLYFYSSVEGKVRHEEENTGY